MVNARLIGPALALAAVLAARGLEHGWLRDIPHVMDEVTYELQAGMLAAGKLSGPAVGPLAAFHQWFVEDRGQRFGIFPPGFPSVLAMGRMFGAATWVNPLLHGLSVLLVHRLGARCFGPAVAAVAGALYAFNPQALILAASRMSHTLAALLALIVIAPGLVLASSGVMAAGWRWLVTGAALGALLATRPLCALVAALALTIAVTAAQPARASFLRAMGATCLGSVLPVGLLLAYHHALTGDALRFPQSVFFDSHIGPVDAPFFHYRPGCNGLGFGFPRGCAGMPDGFGLAESLAGLELNVASWLVLAAAGGLGLLPIVALLRVPAERLRAALLCAPLLLSLVAYALYWSHGTCYGARFYHAGLPTFVLASAAGWCRPWWRERLKALAAVAVALGTTAALARAQLELDRPDYWGVDDRFVRFASAYQGPDALVLVAFATPGTMLEADDLGSTGVPVAGWDNSVRVLSAQLVNAPFLDGKLVFARYHPALAEPTRRAFPARTPLLYVFHDRPEDDVVVPLDRLRMSAGAGSFAAPPENFSGFVLSTPLPGRPAFGGEHHGR